MQTSTSLFLGIMLPLLGLAILGLVLALTRLAPRNQPRSGIQVNSPMLVGLNPHGQAVLLIEQGGRIAHINQTAREWFNAWEDEPNLERLARRTHPAATFLAMCATEGQARFFVNNRAVDGTSYATNVGGSRRMVVALQRPQLILEENPEGPAGNETAISQAFGIFSQLSQAMASSLKLEPTLLTILSSIQQLIPADFPQICLWNTDRRLLTPYRLSKMAEAEHRLEQLPPRSIETGSYDEHLVFRRQHLLIKDVNAFRQLHPSTALRGITFRSYIAVPLLVGGELIGTLELASLAKDGFSQNDLDVLVLLSGQAGVALRNALIYEQEQRRTIELAGLAKLTQAISSVRDHHYLFSRLVDSITPLLNVEILGFSVYDENRRILQGQAPFQGIQETTLEWTRVEILPGSPAEALWQQQEIIVAEDAQNDPRLKTYGLDHLAMAAGIRQMVMVPLTSGGRSLGYLQAANKINGTAFDEDDLRLLSIIAGQSAPIIENAALVLQSTRRAQRAETLRRIASLAGSSATLDEVLKYSLQDLARLLQADYAAIFVLDEVRNDLRLHRGSVFGIAEAQAATLARLPLDDPQARLSVTLSQKPFLSDDVTQDERVLTMYHPLVFSLELHSAIVVPLVTRNRGIGELMLGSREIGFFNQNDLQSVSTAAGQLAAAIEQAHLYSQTDEGLRRRLDHFTALARISRELNSTINLEYLIQLVYDEAVQTTRADCGAILLFDTFSHSPAEGSTAASGQALRLILHVGDPLEKTLPAIEKKALEAGESFVVDNYEEAPETVGRPPHEGIQSAMVVPIAYQEQTAGLIILHARTPSRFDPNAREVVEALSVQAAIALGNAHRYNEQLRRNELLNRRVETQAKLLEITEALQSHQPLEQALENIAYAIQDATPFNTILISRFNPETRQLERIAGAGLSLSDMQTLREHPQSWDMVQQVLQAEFRIGNAYFIPYERMPILPAELHAINVLPMPEEKSGQLNPHAWHPDDVLALPLLDADKNPLGLISVDAPRNGLRPDQPTIETLEIFASQCALVIATQNRFNQLSSRQQSLEHDIQRASKSLQESQTSLTSLVQREMEQTLLLQQLSQRSQRQQAVMEVIASISRAANKADMLQTLASELIDRLGLDTALVVAQATYGPHLIFQVGDLPPLTNIDALLGQRSPFVTCIQSRQVLVTARLDSRSNWSGSPLLASLSAQAFICIPIVVKGRTEYAVLATSKTALPAFTGEDETSLDLLARQLSASLESLETLEETRQRLDEVRVLLDFSRRLGSLEPSKVLQTLLSSVQGVLPAAQAGLVVLWEARQRLLIPQAASGYADNQQMLAITYRSGEGIPGKVFETLTSMRLDEVDFAAHYNLTPENLLRYRNATGGMLPVSSMAIPIQHAQSDTPLGVLVLDNFKIPAAFNEEALALATSLTAQTALTLENTRLYQAAEQRASQLQALTDVAALISSSLHPDELVDTLLDRLQAVLPFHTGTLWLRQGSQVVVRAARGFADSEQRIGLRANIADSLLLGEMIQTERPIVVANVNQDSRFPALVEHEYLSWLGVPMIASGEVIGVFALEHREAEFFNSEHVQVAITFASQAAVALENAKLYQQSLGRAAELDQRSRRLEMLNRLSMALSESLDPGHLVRHTLQALLDVLQCSSTSAILFDKEGQPQLLAEIPSGEIALPAPLPPAPIFDRLAETLSLFNTEDVSKESELAPLAEHLEAHRTRGLLALSLATGGQLLGVLFAHTDQPYRFTPDEMELATTISNQAAVAIQNARLYAETRSLTDELDQRVRDRTQQLEQEHRRAETLLRIITELSASLDLAQVLNSTLQVLNEILEAEQIDVLFSRPGEKELQILARLGGSESDETHTHLARQVIRQRQSVLMKDTCTHPLWEGAPAALQPYHSAMAVPLMVGAEVFGAILCFHTHPDHFSPGSLDLTQATANQVAVSVNNAELYRLIRDQAEDLGQMVRNQQIETQRTKEILESVADGVLVTDDTATITLFNDSAEWMLNLPRQQVLGKQLEDFIGLFGGAGQSWMETIQAWSEDPDSYQPGETGRGSAYAEQIELDNGRVISVHLAPVRLRDNFLGTVSIFRDITHQVEVDRLKSEFVATVSHELRTPMTSIKGYVDLLLMGAGGELNEQQRRFLDIVKSNTERLANLVNDLLDISRIEAGRVQLSFQPLDLQEMGRKSIADLKQRMQREGKPMNIEFEAPDYLPRARGDMERIYQVLENLLENAYYYTPENGSICLRLHPEGDFLQIDVRDNGIGVPPEMQTRVFERFYRGEHPFVLATSGTGLGLSIVQTLVEMHGGRIWLESAGIPGLGSTFSFTLPVFQTEKEEV